MSFRKLGQRLHLVRRLRRIAKLLRRPQAEVPLRNGNARVPRQPAEHRRFTRLRDRRLEHPEVALTRRAIEDHARQPKRRVEALEAEDHGGNTAGALGGIEDKHHGQPQQLCDLRAASGLRGSILAIEQAHHAFDDNRIGTRRRTAKDVRVRPSRQHPRVEIACAAACNARVVAGIEKVRTAFERLHDGAAPAQGCDDRERHGGLAHAARGSCNQEAVHRLGSTGSEPLSASGRPAIIRTATSATAATR